MKNEPSTNQLLSTPFDRSVQRDFSRHLCGWTFDRNTKDSFVQFLDGLCGKQEYTRAAMIAVFQLKIRLAIEILSKGADSSLDSSNLRMAAIALSGFSFEKSAIWRSQCATAQNQINDPHLRAIFAFLTPDNGSYDKVLVKSKIFFFYFRNKENCAVSNVKINQFFLLHHPDRKSSINW